MEGNTFLEFLCEFVRKLEARLRAPENSLVFQEDDDSTARNKAYAWQAVFACGQTYRLGYQVAWPKDYAGRRFLLELAIREIQSLFDGSNFFRQGDGGHWCFYPYAHDWHTPESLAAAVYEMICARAFQCIENSFGIAPLTVSCVAGMGYENRSPTGKISFHTGDLLSIGKVISVDPYEQVLFTEKNAHFIRKQFAGVGENSLLFTRDRSGQPYIYAGYLETGESKTGESTFLSIQIKRDGMWVLSASGRSVLQVKSRDVFLPEDPIGQIRSCLETEFGKGAAKRLIPVLKALRGHKHGTSVIFLNGADEPSRKMLNRLERSGRAFRIEKVHIMKQKDGKKAQEAFNRLLADIACVDGAFIFDYHTCKLLYVNAIVDGLALLPGRPERGARHNALESAIATLAASDSSRQVKAAAVIFSEDRGISAVTASDCRKKLDENDGWPNWFPAAGP